MRHVPRVAALIAALATLGACAPTVWVRPSTSMAEAQAVSDACNFDASLGTVPSDVHIRHNPHRMASSIGAGLVEGIIGAIDEGIQHANLMNQCMTANGFRKMPVQSPVQVASAAPPPQAPPYAPPYAAPDAAPYAVPFVADTPLAARPAPAQPAPQRLVEARRPAEPAPDPEARRAVMVQQVMTLSDQSSIRTGFLLGACSAGDATACILSSGGGSPRSRRTARLF